MKIQIDTTAKTIKVENTVNIKKLYDFLKKILEDDFDSYSICTNTTIQSYSYPIYYPSPLSRPYGAYYDITCNSTSTAKPLNNITLTNTTKTSSNLINYEIN